MENSQNTSQLGESRGKAMRINNKSISPRLRSLSVRSLNNTVAISRSPSIAVTNTEKYILCKLSYMYIVKIETIKSSLQTYRYRERVGKMRL